MLLQDAAIVVLLVAPGLAAIYWLRRLRLFSRLRLRARAGQTAEAASLGEPLARRRPAPAASYVDEREPDRPQDADAIALGAERVRGLQATAEEQLDAAQYALKRLMLDLQGVMPALRNPPPVVVRLPEPQRAPNDRALAA